MSNNEQMPLVSVCMITYNHEAFIRQAIEGVLMQKTDFPIELIISEDCSTDGTRGIVKEFQEKFPNIIVADLPSENRGMKANSRFNKSLAKGKYIAFCEGDDYWIDPLKLQKQVDFLEANLDYGLVYTDFKAYDQESGTYKKIPLQIAEGNAYEQMILEKCHIWTLTVCFRKHLLNFEYSNDPDLFTGDIYLWLEITKQSKVKYFDIETAVYRVLKNSASHFTDQAKKRYFMYTVANTHLYFINKYSAISNRTKRFVRKSAEIRRLNYALYTNNQDVINQIQYPLFPISRIKDVAIWGVAILSKLPRILYLINAILKKKAGRGWF